MEKKKVVAAQQKTPDITKERGKKQSHSFNTLAFLFYSFVPSQTNRFFKGNKAIEWYVRDKAVSPLLL